jgi:hypothetical protein
VKNTPQYLKHIRVSYVRTLCVRCKILLW